MWLLLFIAVAAISRAGFVRRTAWPSCCLTKAVAGAGSVAVNSVAGVRTIGGTILVAVATVRRRGLLLFVVGIAIVGAVLVAVAAVRRGWLLLFIVGIAVSMAGIVKGNRLNKVQVYLLLPAMLLMLKISSLSVARTVAVIILVDVATVREILNDWLSLLIFKVFVIPNHPLDSATGCLGLRCPMCAVSRVRAKVRVRVLLSRTKRWINYKPLLLGPICYW